MIASIIRLSAGLPARMSLTASAVRPIAFAAPQKHVAVFRRTLSVSASAHATAAETVGNTFAAAVDSVKAEAAPKARKALSPAQKEKKAAAKEKKSAAKQAAKEKKAAAKERKAKKLAKDKKLKDAKAPPKVLASKPKRASPYIMFVGEKRPELREDPEFFKQNSNGERVFDVTAFSRRIGSLWTALPEAQKDQYKQKAAQQNALYQKNLQEWVKRLTPTEIKAHNTYVRHRRSKGRNGIATIKDPSKPKAPQTGFLRYLNENRSRLKSEVGESAPVTKVVIKGADEWRALGDSEKAPYEEAYRAEKAKYEVALGEWKARQS